MIVHQGFSGPILSPGPIPGKYAAWPDADLRSTPPPPAAAAQLSLAYPYLPKRAQAQGGGGASFVGSVANYLHPPTQSPSVA